MRWTVRRSEDPRPIFRKVRVPVTLELDVTPRTVALATAKKAATRPPLNAHWHEPREKVKATRCPLTARARATGEEAEHTRTACLAPRSRKALRVSADAGQAAGAVTLTG